MKTAILLFSALLLNACANAQQYVVLRDVPASPTFVVFPESDSPRDYVWADEISAGLIANRVKVLQRPAILNRYRTAETTFKAGDVSLQEEEKIASNLFNNTDADYIVWGRARGRHITVVRQATNELLYSGVLIDAEFSSREELIRKMLLALGVLRYQPVDE